MLIVCMLYFFHPFTFHLPVSIFKWSCIDIVEVGLFFFKSILTISAFNCDSPYHNIIVNIAGFQSHSLKILFIDLFLAVLGLCCRRSFSLAAPLLWCVGFSLWWLLLFQSMGSRAHGLQQL